MEDAANLYERAMEAVKGTPADVFRPGFPLARLELLNTVPVELFARADDKKTVLGIGCHGLLTADPDSDEGEHRCRFAVYPWSEVNVEVSYRSGRWSDGWVAQAEIALGDKLSHRVTAEEDSFVAWIAKLLVTKAGLQNGAEKAEISYQTSHMRRKNAASCLLRRPLRRGLKI